jgi:hypothetical protein
MKAMGGYWTGFAYSLSNLQVMVIPDDAFLPDPSPSTGAWDNANVSGGNLIKVAESMVAAAQAGPYGLAFLAGILVHEVQHFYNVKYPGHSDWSLSNYEWLSYTAQDMFGWALIAYGNNSNCDAYKSAGAALVADAISNIDMNHLKPPPDWNYGQTYNP